MRFVFLFPGKTRADYLDAGIRDYAARLNRFARVEFIVPKVSSAGKTPQEVQKKQETLLLLDKCKTVPFLVVLDPGGQEINSESLAEYMATWGERGLREIYFVIGGQYGLHEEILERADFVLSLSRMTFTHEMARLILLEQLYRGCMINAGRSYHY